VANTGVEQRRELRQRRIEFAIGRVWAPVSDREFETEVLFEQQFFVVAGGHNPWTRRRRVRLAELIDGPWVMPSRAGAAGELAAGLFRASGLQVPRSNVVTSSFQLMQRLLEEGPFLALLPALVLPSLTRNSSLRILPVSLPDQSSPVGITRLRNRRLSPVAEIFIAAARSIAKSVPSTGRKFARRAAQEASAGRSRTANVSAP
jgi:DNA-binding transcriptional LysR family regulator